MGYLVLLKKIEMCRLVSSEEDYYCAPRIELQVLERLGGKGVEPTGEFVMPSLGLSRRHTPQHGRTRYVFNPCPDSSQAADGV